MLAIVEHLSIYAALAIIVFAFPYVYTSGYFTKQRYNVLYNRAPELRMVNYLGNLLGSRDAVKEMRLFGLQDNLLARFDKLWTKFIHETRGLSVNQQTCQFLLLTLSMTGTVIVWGFAVVQAVASKITIGSMVLYMQGTKSACDTLAHIFSIGGGLLESSLFLSHLFSFLDIKADSVEGSLDRSAAVERCHLSKEKRASIEFRNVSFRYPGSAEFAIKNVSFKIEPGEHIALVGPNGSGKSTLIKLLTRLYDPTEGEIFFDNKKLIEFNLLDIRRYFSVLLQDFLRYQLSVRENIGFGMLEKLNDDIALLDAADKAGCSSLIESFPKQYGTVLGRSTADGVDLSGGEWQKIALARAFIRNAEFVILDEPTAAVDPIAEEQIFNYLAELMLGKSCLIVSHRFSTVRSMERILVLDKGYLVEQGSHMDLMLAKGLYSDMYSTQASRYQDKDYQETRY